MSGIGSRFCARIFPTVWIAAAFEVVAVPDSSSTHNVYDVELVNPVALNSIDPSGEVQLTTPLGVNASEG